MQIKNFLPLDLSDTPTHPHTQTHTRAHTDIVCEIYNRTINLHSKQITGERRQIYGTNSDLMTA